MKSLKEVLRKTESLVFGRENVLKLAEKGKISEIIITSNAAEKQKIIDIAEMENVPVIELKESNEELGSLCRKPFSISVLGVKK